MGQIRYNRGGRAGAAPAIEAAVYRSSHARPQDWFIYWRPSVCPPHLSPPRTGTHAPRSYYFVSTFDNSHEFLDILTALAEESKLSVCIDSEHQFTTQGMHAALQRSMSQRAVGKIVVNVGAI